MTLIEPVRVPLLHHLHHSPRIQEAHVHWIRQFLRFHPDRLPRQTGAEETTDFLNQLAVALRTSASARNQALRAPLFLYLLYERMFELHVPRLEGLAFAQRPAHPSAVLSRQEILALLDRLVPPRRPSGDRLHGTGLRLLNALSIHAKDVDLERLLLMVRRDKGQHDRPALLYVRARDTLRAQLETVARRHDDELAARRGEVDIPHALRTEMHNAAPPPCLAVSPSRLAPVHRSGDRSSGSVSPPRASGAEGRP